MRVIYPILLIWWCGLSFDGICCLIWCTYSNFLPGCEANCDISSLCVYLFCLFVCVSVTCFRVTTKNPKKSKKRRRTQSSTKMLRRSTWRAEGPAETANQMNQGYGCGFTLCYHLVKEAFSILMLCTPGFIFTSGSSALLGRPRCGLSNWQSLLAVFNTLFRVSASFSNEKTDKTRDTRSPPFSNDTETAADGYWARKALILRESSLNKEEYEKNNDNNKRKS